MTTMEGITLEWNAKCLMIDEPPSTSEGFAYLYIVKLGLINALAHKKFGGFLISQRSMEVLNDQVKNHSIRKVP